MINQEFHVNYTITTITVEQKIKKKIKTDTE